MSRACPGPVYFGDQGIERCTTCHTCICCDNEASHEDAVRFCWTTDEGECILVGSKIPHTCGEAERLERHGHDSGDEDDIDVLNASWRPDKKTIRSWVGIRWVIGPPVFLYACERVHPPAEHDPGDEQPRLDRMRGLMRYMDGV